MMTTFIELIFFFCLGGSTKVEIFLKVLSPPILEDPSPVQFTSKGSLVMTCKLLREETSVVMKWDKKDSQIKVC